MERLIIKKIKNIQKTIENLQLEDQKKYSNNYFSDLNHSTEERIPRNITNNYYGFSDPLRSIIINNNNNVNSQKEFNHKDDKKEDNGKEITTNQAALAGLTLIAITGTTSYFVSTDPYQRFLKSDIDNQVEELYALCYNDNRYNLLINTIKYNYDEWKKLFIQNGGVSTGVFITGMLLGSVFGIAIGTVGAMGTVVYYVYNKKDNDSEKDYFDTFSSSINELESCVNSVLTPSENPEFNNY